MSVNNRTGGKIEAAKFETETKIENNICEIKSYRLVKNTTTHPSTAPTSSVKLKLIFKDRIYSPPVSNHQQTLLAVQSAPASVIHWDTTVTNFFTLIISMVPLPPERIRAKIVPVQNENISYDLQRPSGGKYITFARLCLIGSMRNACVLLDYVHMTKYNRIDEKCSDIPIVHFYILVLFKIRRHFCASPSVRVSDSGQTVNCDRNFCTTRTCRHLHNYTPAHFTCHHAFLNTLRIQHTKTFSLQPITCSRKYCMR